MRLTVKVTFMLTVLLTVWSPAYCLDPAPGVRSTLGLRTDSSWDGKQIEYPKGQAEVTGMLIEVDPGQETGWHRHSVPSFAMVIEGELEVTLQDGRKKLLKAGDLLAEVVDVTHTGKNVGSGVVKLVVFYAGAKGMTLTEKLEVK